MRLAKDNICLSAVAQNENGQVESAARETLSEREREKEGITNENEIRRQKLCKATANRNAAKSKKKSRRIKISEKKERKCTLDMPQV